MTAVASTPQSIASQHPAFVKFTAMEKELNQQFFERRDAIRGIILALLCKEHAFLLGTPGTGKTYLIREIMRRINNAQYFEAILSKTRPTEAVLGPYDIPKLRDHGNLVRKTQDYLPTSDLAMLDEVGKMPPTLGHDLLSIVLDRIIHQVDGSGTSHVSNDPVIYHKLMAEGKEGVVAKLLTAPYVSGRSPAWLKHKAKYRLTTIVVGYEPGTGKRKECGAFNLALIDTNGVPVRMGKVGSGFTDADIAEYKARLDGGKLWLAEIETMGLTDSGALRQPIFKGERTDLSITDASTTQLDTLPKGTTAP